MKINLEVTTLDAVTTKVSAQFADFIAFETEKNRSVANFQQNCVSAISPGWRGTRRSARRRPR